MTVPAMRFALALLLILLSLPAFALESGIGSFGGWRAFRVIEKGQHVCYMIAHPSNSTGSGGTIEKAPVMKEKKSTKKTKGKKAPAPLPREAYAMLTFRPAESTAPVFSYNGGAMLKDGAEATLTSGKEKISLFISGDSAWARTGAIDKQVAQLLRKGSGTMEITSPTAKGGALRDRFDLKGADSAYKKIATACGIP